MHLKKYPVLAWKTVRETARIKIMEPSLNWCIFQIIITEWFDANSSKCKSRCYLVQAMVQNNAGSKWCLCQNWMQGKNLLFFSYLVFTPLYCLIALDFEDFLVAIVIRICNERVKGRRRTEVCAGARAWCGVRTCMRACLRVFARVSASSPVCPYVRVYVYVSVFFWASRQMLMGFGES